MIERGVILSEAGVLELGDLRPSGPARAADSSWLTLEEGERRHILAVLERTRRRVIGRNGATEILGLKPPTLQA